MRIIFFTGQSGSGKDTQSEFLVNYLKEQGKSVLYINNGKNVRGYDTGSWMSNLIRENNKKGLLAPQMTVSYLAQKSMEEFGENTPDFIIWNGSPREYDELVGLKNLMKFFDVKGEVVFLSVSNNICRQRIAERAMVQNRPEMATEEALNNKLDYFDKKTVGVIAILQDERQVFIHHFKLITVFAENPPEAVFSLIKNKLKI